MQLTLAGVAAYAAFLLSNGPNWITTEKLAVFVVMALQTFSSSVWHYGARSDIYAKKWWDPVYVRNPWRLLMIGGTGFFLSILLAAIYLPAVCVGICIANTVIILLYAKRLDRYWPWKNLFIAGVCITPLLCGWYAGNRTSDIVMPLIIATYLTYFAREVLKDMYDIDANRYERITMVMDWETPRCLRIAGGCLLTSAVLIAYMFQYLPPNFFIQLILGSVGTWFTVLAIVLMFGVNLSKKYKLIDIGVILAVLSLLLVRAQMY